MFTVKNLRTAEHKISELLSTSETDWKTVAKIAITVKEKELWKQSGERSFTAWVDDVAKKCDRHPSLIWRYIKATKYYLHVVDSKDLQSVNLAVAAPEALVNLEKVERNAPLPVFEKLKERVIAGSVTVKETRRIEREYRPKNASSSRRGRPLKEKEGCYEHLGLSKEERAESQNSEIKDLPRAQIAATIARSLKVNLNEWTRQCADMSYPPKFAQDHTEVRVNDNRQRFRLDLVAVVRWSFKKPKDIFVVEIKSGMLDYTQDSKWQNYLKFCDYFCWAIPKHERELLEIIELFTDTGILLVDFNAEVESNMAYPLTVYRLPIKNGNVGQSKYLIYETLYERVQGWKE